MQNLHELFRYEDGRIYWLIRPSKRTKAGERAGYAHNDGYRQVSVSPKRIMEHRVIWEMHNGPIPDGMQIDHINHVRDDNRIENLRLVTGKDNSRNKKLNRRNTSGFTGVQFNKEINKWLARIVVDGKVITIGYFETFDEAKSARISRQEKENFHENHGLGQ
ncbi:MAG: HNH nuclease [Caudoviricetes sp.]|nr:MAG: HNH nuclease [Caudoviricetes sp.]